MHHAATAASQASSRSRTTRIASISESLGRHGAKRERLAPVFLPQSDLDNGIVGWDGQDDPEMPLMFTARRKWLIVGLLSGITFITPFASSILAPGIRYLEQDFQRGAVLASMPVSIYLLGYAVGK